MSEGGPQADEARGELALAVEVPVLVDLHLVLRRDDFVVRLVVLPDRSLACRNGSRMSMGIGMMIVVEPWADISFIVCR